MFTRVFTFLIIISTLIFSGGFSPLGYAETPDMTDLRGASSKVVEYCVGSGYKFTSCNESMAAARAQVCGMVAASSTSVSSETSRNWSTSCQGDQLSYTYERRLRYFINNEYEYQWHKVGPVKTYLAISTIPSEYKYEYSCPPVQTHLSDYKVKVKKINGSESCAKPCKLPFSNDGEQCVTYCPPNASKFDMDLGRCVPRHDKNQ
jgi:hypothetical protein